MLGLIHVIMKDLVVSKFGKDKWELVMAELNLEDDAEILDVARQYDDAVTVAGVEAVSKVLGAPWDAALELYGAHFVAYVYEGGYGRMLRSMGDNLQDFLHNVNHMHQYLERHFRESSFPVWGVEPEGPNSFILSYSSSRGLALKGIIKGLLSEAARQLFRQKVDVEELDETRAGFLLTLRVVTTALPENEWPTPRSVDAEHKKNASLWHQCLASVGRTGLPSLTSGVASSVWTAASEGLLGACLAPQGASAAAAATFDEPSEEAADETAQARGPSPLLSSKEQCYLDGLAAKVRQDPQRAGDVLMRAAPAATVCAEWKDAASLDSARVFWETYAGDTRYFSLSRCAPRAARFVSHSWRPPRDWAQVMGEQANYAEIKATELTIVAQDIFAKSQGRSESLRAAETGIADGLGSWKDVLFWVDKCCIPQGHPLIKEYFSRLEDFIQRSDGMVVLLSWQYFERLWCIYEWASFLVYHSASNVQICVDYFLKPATQQLYLNSVEKFSVASAQCDVESDRAILRAKIAQHFNSETCFEKFAKVTAVALLAQTAVRRAGRNKSEYEAEFAPWIQMAERLGFQRLVAALRTARPMAWRVEAMRDSKDCLGHAAQAWLERYDALIMRWFEEQVLPEVFLVRDECVRGEFLGKPDVLNIEATPQMQPHETLPKCPACACAMQWSDSAEGVYAQGWDCEFGARCGATCETHGPWRWLCKTCSIDLCQPCAFRGQPLVPDPLPQPQLQLEPVRRRLLRRPWFVRSSVVAMEPTGQICGSGCGSLTQGRSSRSDAASSAVPLPTLLPRTALLASPAIGGKEAAKPLRACRQAA